MAALTVALADPMTAAIDRIVEIAEVQAVAIDEWDLERFDRLSAERAALQEALERSLSDGPSAAVLDVLYRATAIDQRNISRVLGMIEQTSRDLDELHRGKIALNGYGQPAVQPVQQGFLIDRMR